MTAANTPEQQPKEHCELEDGYCKRFVCLVDNDGNELGCPWGDCPHDTRSRPHPAPAAGAQHRLSVCGIPAIIEDCPYCDGSGKRMRPEDTRDRPHPAPTFCDKISGGYECAGIRISGMCHRDAVIRQEERDLTNKKWNALKEWLNSANCGMFCTPNIIEWKMEDYEKAEEIIREGAK